MTTGRDALRRAGKRAGIHLVQALIESLKAVEAVIDELTTLAAEHGGEEEETTRRKIEVE